MSDSASRAGGNRFPDTWLALIRQPPPTPVLVAIGFIALLPALLTGGPVAAAVAIWYRGNGPDERGFPLLLAVLVVMGMFATAALALGTAWRRSRETPNGENPSVPPSDASAPAAPAPACDSMVAEEPTR
ncbi:hypothetical protein [Nocardia concava]|uniref:hypothetical protein n=1 Tax=Nocardia concava TaxID=257281 RepID=UPI0012F73947|nr:hypothetical protein [Nocardia concava]